MSNDVPEARLRTVKDRLGRLVFLDFKGQDLPSAHRELGQEVRGQVQKILGAKLDRLDRKQIMDQLRTVRRSAQSIQDRARSPRMDDRIRLALYEYLSCLAAWSEGVGLDAFQHSAIQNLVVDGCPPSPQELALWLQNDNSGCQTGVLRMPDGSVALWHTEEDVEDEPGARFDRVRIASFQIQDRHANQTISAFIYPDLLPGPGFGWRSDGFVQAIDALYLRTDVQDGYMLANVSAWITLRLGELVAPENIVQSLSPYLDGYALFGVWEEGGYPDARRVVYAGNQMEVSRLGDKPGSFLFQVNIFSDKDAPMASRYEAVEPGTRERFEERILRTENWLRGDGQLDHLPEDLFRLLASQEGGDEAYANEHVKCYFVCQISRGHTRGWIGAGPALAEDELATID